MDHCLRPEDVTINKDGNNPRKFLPAKVGLRLALCFLVVSAACVHWGGFGYARLADYIWSQADDSLPGRRDTTTRQGAANLSLVACLAVTIMISILHVSFKWPFFSNASGEEPASHRDRERSPCLPPACEKSEQLFFSNGDGLEGQFEGPSPDDGVNNQCSVEEFVDIVPDASSVAVEWEEDDETCPLLADRNQSHSTASDFAEEPEGSTHNLDVEREFLLTGEEIKTLEALDTTTSLSSPAHPGCPHCAEDKYAGVAHVGTQTTDDGCRCEVTTVGTMTSNPGMVDVSVNTHQRLCKIVKHCGTSTSGPFMKKLRRAQRLMTEASVKTKQERQDKLSQWRTVVGRYKEKLSKLFENLEKKDRLLGYTSLNRAMSENEVKEICTAVRSSRDRLLTQCKLNSALKEVIESKSEVPPTVASP